MDRHLTRGFTLLELLVTMAVAGILLSVGVPSFSDAIKESRLSTQYNAMVGSLYLARSEAVKGIADVTVCPRSAPATNQCGTKDDWNNGWLVFMDNTRVQGEATAKVDADDEIVAVEMAPKGENTILAIGSSSNSAANAREVAFIRYTRNGSTEWNSGSVIVCDSSRGAAASRVINIVLTGDIRRGRSHADEQAPRDVFNQPISKYCTAA